MQETTDIIDHIIACSERAHALKPQTDAAFAKALNPGATLVDFMEIARLMREIDPSVTVLGSEAAAIPVKEWAAVAADRQSFEPFAYAERS